MMSIITKIFGLYLTILAISQNAIPQNIAAGAGHTVVLKKDGNLWAFGDNSQGQLGDHSFINHTIPIQITHKIRFTQIACGESHTVALAADGSVWTWGSNKFGQLGIGNTLNQNSPTSLNNISDIVSISCGWWHTLAIDRDGQIWAWGRNSEGQIGDATKNDAVSPVNIKNLPKIEKIAGGWGHTMALDSFGKLWAWGGNRSGQLGNGKRDDEPVPILVNISDILNDNISDISCGGWHSVALTKSGSVWAWGGNSKGQVGNNNTKSSGHPLPQKVRNVYGSEFLSNIKKIIGGGWMHTAAIQENNTVLTWGSNLFGQCGHNLYMLTDIPIKILNHDTSFINSTISSMCNGFYHSAVLFENDEILIWGNNDCGQLGTGNFLSSNIPLRLKEYKFENSVFDKTNGFTSTIKNITDNNFLIQKSQNLTDWSLFLDISGFSGDFKFIDNNTSELDYRFYRLIEKQ